MTKILIPRSDSISAKIIEPTDFTYLHSSDLIQNYAITPSGWNISAGTGLACVVGSGTARVNGLYVENTGNETLSGLTASQTNSIYIKLDLDSGSQPEGWSLFANTTGATVANAFKIGTAVTNGSGVTTTTQVATLANSTKPHNFTTTNTELIPFNVLGDQSLQNIGSGTAGDILYSNGTNWTKLAKGSDGQYLKLASGVPVWTTLEDTIPTVTHQHGVLGGGTSNTWAKLGTHGDAGTLTVATRANGKFLCILNMNIKHSTGQNDASFEIRVDGTKVDEWIRETTRNSGSGDDWYIPHIVTLSGPLDGRTIEIWGYHPWSSSNNVGATIASGATSGDSTYSIWEWSEL